MKNKILLVAILLLALGAGALMLIGFDGGTTESGQQRSNKPPPSQPAWSHTGSENAPRVPAYQTVSEARSLPPTLPPSEFFGKAREAYKVAKEIPQTLAQLPCYCHCDQSFGHKSLHTSFVDDHAAHCAICVDEALLAFRLQQEEKLTPEQVRERIIEKYSVEHQHE